MIRDAKSNKNSRDTFLANKNKHKQMAQKLSKMAQKLSKIAQNYPKWPKNDTRIYALFPQIFLTEKAVPQTFSLLECNLYIAVWWVSE